MATINPNSPDAVALRDWLSARVDKHRAALESLSVPTDRVPELRGRVAEARALLQWLNNEDTHG